jgi:predicted phosphodiesterase
MDKRSRFVSPATITNRNRRRPVPEKTPKRLAAEQLCRKFPDAPNRTLAKRLAAEYQCSIDQARSLIRVVRGAYGTQRAEACKDKSLFRPKGKAGTKPKLPPSLAKKWEPFELGGGIRVGILSDIHIPYHDERALAAAVDYLKRRRPDVVLLNGDYGDFYSISRFTKNPKKRNFKREIKLQRDGLKWLRSQFPKARLVYKMGNHDERYDHWLWNHAPEISDLPQVRLPSILGCKKLGIEVVGDGRPVMAGKLAIFHGHEMNGGPFAPAMPARSCFLRTTASVLVGHHHRTSTHVEPNWKHEEIACWSVGCLCDLTPEYARVNKYNQGLSLVDVSEDGQFEVANLRLNTDYAVRSG